MRILFSANAELGHLLPMLPLATAARDAGHDVVVLCAASMAAAVAPVPLVAVGPEFGDLVAENVRRYPAGWGSGDGSEVGPVEAAQLYADTRLDVTLDDARRAALDFRPDLVVGEVVDYVGPMLAAGLGVPWAMHALGPAFPAGFVDALEAPLPGAYRRRGLDRTERVAYLDPCPDFLQPPGWTAPADRIPLRPRAHAGAGVAWDPPPFPGRDALPTVLVTLGTMVDDASVHHAVLDAVSTVDVNVVVTWAPCGDPATADVDRSRVHPVGFVALERLLAHVDAVVAPGGSGTLLGSLSAGRPLVLHPMFADHHGNAERAAATGAAVVAGTLDALGPALTTVLDDPSYAAAAARVARRIAAVPSAADALRRLGALAHA